jgi:hypothetical protein
MSNAIPISLLKYTEILATLDLPLRSLEKDEYGEVMTPPKLIEEVLEHLPIHVWRNPNLRWLDPASGIGNFFALVFYRLMRGLARAIPNTEKRASHIVSNMLFMYEINMENVAKSRDLFGSSANIVVGDFLQEMESQNQRFDIIVGNPPYQMPDKENASWGAKGRNAALWTSFIESGFKVLNPNGFLGVITPASWRSPAHPLLAEIKDLRYLSYLHIYGKAAGIELFHVQTRFDIYLVENRAPTFKDRTEIVDEHGRRLKMSVREWPFLPNYFYKEIKEILVLPKSQRKTRKRSSSGSIRTMEPIYHSNTYNSKELAAHATPKIWKYPVVHTITKKGLGILYSDHPAAEQTVPKVLLNFNEKQYPYNDFKGEYGMSQLTFGIPIQNKKEGDELVKYINSPFFKEVVKATKWGAFYTSYKMFQWFRFPHFQ